MALRISQTYPNRGSAPDARTSRNREGDTDPGSATGNLPPGLIHRARNRRTGRFLVGLGIFGVIATVIGVVVALLLISQTGGTLQSSLEVTAQAVNLAEDTVDVAADSLSVAASSLEQVEATTGASVQTFSKMSDAFDDAAVIVGSDVPGTIEAVRRTTPILIDTAELLSSTLGALSFLGVEVPAEAPAEALRDVDRELIELSASLTSEGALIADIAEDFDGFSDDAELIAADMTEASAALARVEQIVESYRQTSREAVVVIDQAVADLDGQLRLARFMVVVLGLVVLAGQAVPIMLGLRLADDGLFHDVTHAPDPEALR